MRLLTGISAAIATFFTAMGYVALSDYFSVFGLQHVLASLSAYPMMARFGIQVMSSTPQILPILLALALYVALLAYALRTRRRFPNVVYRAKGRPYRDGFISGSLNIVFDRRMAENFRIWATPMFTGIMLLFLFGSSVCAERQAQAMIGEALSGHPLGFTSSAHVTQRLEVSAPLERRLLPFTHGRQLRLLWDDERELTATVALSSTKVPFTLPIIHIDKTSGEAYSVPITFHSFTRSRPFSGPPFFSTFMLALGGLMLIIALLAVVLAYLETKDRVADLTIRWDGKDEEILQLPLRIAQRMYDALVDGQLVEFRELGRTMRNRLYRLSPDDKIELTYTVNEFTLRLVIRSVIGMAQRLRAPRKGGSESL